jgi:outer membrane protein insertion porin family
MKYRSNRSRLLSLSLILVFLLSGLSAQEEPVVKEIVIEGLRTIEAKEVLGIMRTRVGERSSPEMRREDLQSVYNLGYFSEDIRIYKEDLDDGLKITVSLRENPVIEDITVIGNMGIKASKIIAFLPFKKGEILPSAAVIKGRMEIERLYSNNGFKNSRVKIRTDEVENEKKALVTVVVDEGKKVLVKDLVINGNENYSAFRLRFLLDNKGSWSFIRNYYDETTFDDDLETLRRFYRNRGFLDIEVKRGRPEYNEKKGWIRPVIEIKEGPRYKVNDVLVKNATLFTKDEIAEKFSSLTGNFFNASKYAKAMQNLKKLYGDEGFIRLEVSPDFRRLPEGHYIDLVLEIKENERVYVGKIKVRRLGFQRGTPESSIDKMYNKFSPPPEDEVILREVTLKPGEAYRTFDEVRTVERLKRLEIFEEVSITREPTEDKDVRDVVVNVREGVTGNIIFGVGYGDSPGGYFQVRVNERNLFGDARDLRFNALLGTKRSSYHISYLDRYFRDTDKSLEFQLYRDTYGRREYSERRYGSALEIGKPLSEYVRAFIRTRVEHVNFFDEDDDIREDLDSYALATARLRVIEDRRDDTWWPTRGYTRGAGIEVGYADGPLAKLTMEASWFRKIYKELIYAVDFSGGLIPYNSRKVGITERFFMGGSNDLRGFSFRGAGPMDDGEDDMAIGGSTKLLLKNELRYPIYGDLKGVFFLDTGMLDESIGLDTPRVSVGTGVRIKVSIIRLYLDFAKALCEHDDDDTQIFHFRLGAAF